MSDAVTNAMLDAATLRAALVAHPALTIEVVAQIDSTNRELLERPSMPRAPHALLAQRQSAGRGRRGRRWLADAEGSLCLSLAWWSARPPRDTAALGIVAGVACAQALRDLAPAGTAIGLKWPNDLVVGERKLGGILVEARAEQGGTRAVIGIGLNLCLPAALVAELHAAGSACTDLHAQLGAATPSHNTLAAALLDALLRQLAEFERGGIAAAADAWPAFDVLAGRTVRVLGGADERSGVARGIDPHGALWVEFDDGVTRVHAGEVSVRP